MVLDARAEHVVGEGDRCKLLDLAGDDVHFRGSTQRRTTAFAPASRGPGRCGGPALWPGLVVAVANHEWLDMGFPRSRRLHATSRELGDVRVVVAEPHRWVDVMSHGYDQRMRAACPHTFMCPDTHRTSLPSPNLLSYHICFLPFHAYSAI